MALHQGHKWLSEVSLTTCMGWVLPVLGVNQGSVLEPGGDKTEITARPLHVMATQDISGKYVRSRVALVGVAGHLTLRGI